MIGAQIVTRVVANFAVIAILGQFAPGFVVHSPSALVVAALVLALLASALVWVVFSLVPVAVGIVLLLPINLAAFYGTAWLVPGFDIESLGWAVVGTVLLGGVNALVSDALGRWLQPPSLFTEQEQAEMLRAIETMRAEHGEPQSQTTQPERSESGDADDAPDTPALPHDHQPTPTGEPTEGETPPEHDTHKRKP